jgi:porphyrinogen peroxidase
MSRLLVEPQIGIFALGDPSHSFLEFKLRTAITSGDAVRAVANVHGPLKTTEGVNLVIGFRPELWRSVMPGECPTDARSFEKDLVGPDGYTMPATQVDVFVWIAGASYDNVFDVGNSVVQSLGAHLTLVREAAGWAYQHNKDLTGFQDGTENPGLIEAPSVVLIPQGEPGAGGTILLFQQWKHHTDTWLQLPTPAQERVIGRTKIDSIELPEDIMPGDSHVSRTTLTQNGEELKIFRRNTPYGSVSDHGTMFVGFAREQMRLQRMLEQMAGIPDGVRDALTRYTEPLTGAYYFIPALTTLAKLAAPSAGRSVAENELADSR